MASGRLPGKRGVVKVVVEPMHGPLLREVDCRVWKLDLAGRVLMQDAPPRQPCSERALAQQTLCDGFASEITVLYLAAAYKDGLTHFVVKDD